MSTAYIDSTIGGGRTAYREHVLRPFNAAEVIGIAEAAEMASISPRTMREWCQMYPIGRCVGGHWKVSKPALQMLLDGNDLP